MRIMSAFALLAFAVALASVALGGEPEIAGKPTVAKLVARETVSTASDPGFPTPINVLPVELHGEGGWTGILSDRYTASKAFAGDFEPKAVAEFEAKYGLRNIAFETVLYYKLIARYYEIIATTLERTATEVTIALTMPGAKSPVQPPQAESPGRLILLSEPAGAEVYLGTKLVGTTHLPSLFRSLPETTWSHSAFVGTRTGSER